VEIQFGFLQFLSKGSKNPNPVVASIHSGSLRHSKSDTTANEYMQDLPGSVKQMVGSVYSMLTKKGRVNFLVICYKMPPTAAKSRS
jgi:hypothetical protein